MSRATSRWTPPHRRAARLATLVVAQVLAALMTSGCGGSAFRVVRVSPPRIELDRATEIWIATDLSDSLAARLAQRVAEALVDLAPTRLVRPGAPPGAGVVVVGLGVRRSTSTRAQMTEQPVWTCDPTGSCYVRRVPRMVDLPVVRLLVRLSAHSAEGRSVARPRILDLSETGEDVMGAELRLIGRAARRVSAAFRPSSEPVSLAVEDLGDEPARATLAAAIAAPSPEACSALRRLADAQVPRDERARRLFAAAQCRRAVGLASNDTAALRIAESLLVEAMRASPREAYARALDAPRRLLRAQAESAARASETAEPTYGDETLPPPPASYR